MGIWPDALNLFDEMLSCIPLLHPTNKRGQLKLPDVASVQVIMNEKNIYIHIYHLRERLADKNRLIIIIIWSPKLFDQDQNSII
jgi:hypothetical protein